MLLGVVSLSEGQGCCSVVCERGMRGELHMERIQLVAVQHTDL